ncbi:hypothetical protein LMG3458_02463 [Achromobacter deleyi]|uniref:Uncharacterized protein n=1 Tax=Achromobacter deleyi TaxID=1353891 RepID=A0A6S6ZUJ8_9BURK|nr:hypothetical protein [Achromobacter deleyi]CAB3697421.1 hypothetical protein LMG3458_02463 [Achromobacter deleyi]
MKEAAAVADLLGRDVSIQDPVVLAAVQELCDEIPRILDAWDLLADLAAALEYAQRHPAAPLLAGDALRRRFLVERAESFLSGG